MPLPAVREIAEWFARRQARRLSSGDAEASAGAALPAGLQRGISVALPTGAAAVDDKGRQWIHVLPLGVYDRGDWADPWVISEQVCQEMAGHFGEKLPQAILPWNCNHKRGTEAPGWIEGVEARADGLHVLTRWTALGQQLLADEAFKFVSAEWFWTYKRPSDGTAFRNVLRGCALTNDPFFTELPALAEAEPETDGTADTEDTEDGGSEANDMGEKAKTATTNATTNAANLAASEASGRAPEGDQAGTPARVGTPAPAPTPPAPLPEQGGGGTAAAGGSRTLESAPTGTGPAPGISAAEAADLRRQLAENQAETTRLRLRDERRDILEAVRGIPDPLDARGRMSPAMCENWADQLCLARNDEASAVNVAEAGAAPVLRTQRDRLFDLIAATRREWPMAGARPGGGIHAPEDASALSPAERSQKLHELTQAKAKDMAQASGESANDWYGRRVAAALAEHPELV